ncbi:MAG: L,D-transpeptidase family protein [Pseudolabrys sp.]|nr:L,D-transpeptidase family protein [Pseudolabrys sp.]
MRTSRLLAGSMLAVIAVPTIAWSAPRILQSEPPAPFALRAQPQRQESAPASAPAPVAQEPERQTPQQQTPTPTQRHSVAPDTNNARAQAITPPPVPAPAATPASAPAPAANEPSPVRSTLDRVFGASDAQITDALRNKRVDSFITREVDRKSVETFYKARNFAPLWIKEGTLTPRAKAAIARMNNATADALDPADYAVPAFSGGADALAEDDLKLTNSVLTFSRHLQMGRIAPTRVLAEVDYGKREFDANDTLRKIADAANIDATFDSFNPPHAGFKALKNALAALRANASADEGRIPDGPEVKPGMKDPRVPMLRTKLGVNAPSGKSGDLVYDKALAEAVNRVQAKNDIRGKGILDNRVVGLINGPSVSQQQTAVEANMERWRWLPRDLGRTYVMVNVPDYTLKVVKDNEIVWRTKIVSGKPTNQTPLLTANMQTIVVNPSWYVPQSIIQNELLPQYEKDPQIFDRMGLEVRRGPDGNINVVQPPGAANALGRIKFNFPNKFQVYLHDTPEKKLFSYEKRAFSHGCMRVEDPTKFGEVMLHLAMAGPMPNSHQLDQLMGKDEKIFTLQSQPRVHLTYQTAYVDDAGKLVIRDDIYGFDSRIHTIVTTDERKIADVAPPQDKVREAAATTAKNNQEILRRVERGTTGNPFAFFERIFR